jgi:hypothetical protein
MKGDAEEWETINFAHFDEDDCPQTMGARQNF